MNMNDKIDVMFNAMKACEADLREKYDEDTITLAKAGISSMVQTIMINSMTHGSGHAPWQGAALVAITLMRTLDVASDHAADAVHKDN